MRASSPVIIISCSFSPGRMPTTSMRQRPAPMACATSVIVIEPDLGHEDLAAAHQLQAGEHEVDALVQRIQNRVIRGSVIGSSLAPSATSRWNSGTTLPREPTTLP